MKDHTPDHTVLIAMVGLPYSGKTTAAQKLRFPIVSPDAIRIALHGQRFVASAEPHVWAIARTMVGALHCAGHSQVVLDACNITRQRREDLHGWADEILFYQLETPASECLQRASEAQDVEILPIIQDMAARQELLYGDEPKL